MDNIQQGMTNIFGKTYIILHIHVLCLNTTNIIKLKQTFRRAIFDVF